MKKTFLLFVSCVLMAAAVSCSSAPKVSRVDASTQIDLSGYWNDNDVRIVCKDLIAKCVESPRVAQEIAKMGRTPKVIVGKFKNESNEHIDTSIISTVMEGEIFNTGILDFVAGGGTRDELRAERAEQDDFGADTNGGDLLNEQGADYMLTGSVKTVIDKAGNQTVRTYWLSAEMTNIRTNTRMWIGQNNEIKKVVVQPKNKL
jgi:hypothetical protein